MKYAACFCASPQLSPRWLLPPPNGYSIVRIKCYIPSLFVKQTPPVFWANGGFFILSFPHWKSAFPLSILKLHNYEYESSMYYSVRVFEMKTWGPKRARCWRRSSSVQRALALDFARRETGICNSILFIVFNNNAPPLAVHRRRLVKFNCCCYGGIFLLLFLLLKVGYHHRHHRRRRKGEDEVFFSFFALASPLPQPKPTSLSLHPGRPHLQMRRSERRTNPFQRGLYPTRRGEGGGAGYGFLTF